MRNTIFNFKIVWIKIRFFQRKKKLKKKKKFKFNMLWEKNLKLKNMLAFI